jgi:hypothetical protein
MLYLIGVSHSVQAYKRNEEKTENQQDFSNILEETIRKVHPAFVAEEDSVEALNERKEVSVAKELLQKPEMSGICHKFCDPDKAQRKSINYRTCREILLLLQTIDHGGLSPDELKWKAKAIEIGRFFSIREQFWLQQLDRCLEQNTIFICGYAHLAETLPKLLHSKGVPHEIVKCDVSVTDAQRECIRKSHEYLKNNPSLKTWSHYLLS